VTGHPRWCLRLNSACALPPPRSAGTVRPRPATRGGKTVLARTLASLVAAASRDALGRQMSGALMRRWLLGTYADHRDRTRREESPRRLSGSAARDSRARLRSAGPAPRAAAAQHRHAVCGSAGTLNCIADFRQSPEGPSRCVVHAGHRRFSSRAASIFWTTMLVSVRVCVSLGPVTWQTKELRAK